MKKFLGPPLNGCVILPIQPIETTVFYWKIKQGKEIDFTIGAGFPSFASCGEPYIYGTPALEFPDLIKIMVHGGAECDPDKRTWGAAEGTPKSCLYSMTPDKDYIIDFLGGEFTEDVVVAGGFSGHGFKMAPVVGRMLVDLAIGGAAAAVQRDEEFKHFKVGRFEGNPGGNVKTF
ncbi:putative FAD dependent oxidoreductase, FAD/NAD(P)-binding domain superfamily [Helianthus annuus]|uniref:FAD dependent oxidoreductase, FAD/NAD(P)-binding domain superfamily n=1 Tax=Helianthus annuus TaxID=4232 RepID=A0A9K3HVE1_HELAN|nr:putative FAD dependent oxidoreductase, FAD/NAD(P)-binding domain superfamily [Helianthus annuus]KAJ0520310.1 putative FAD dependent oxidoreductase, FAD/NAD(P)-binding domain superfamily [Helianthus annuus]KAJ0528831.1 putative FAD dependent oxidoreductase, FAD/NAD(P)-binding domain superfamily [Helianthus annuus]KAJ0695744.1 putative FAD dependent oxidoreductase, FAD/NAD(P)-binding domain superfamily [Helianthus annuus]